jgi:hypothetical protein
MNINTDRDSSDRGTGRGKFMNTNRDMDIKN